MPSSGKNLRNSRTVQDPFLIESKTVPFMMPAVHRCVTYTNSSINHTLLIIRWLSSITFSKVKNKDRFKNNKYGAMNATENFALV